MRWKALRSRILSLISVSSGMVFDHWKQLASKMVPVNWEQIEFYLVWGYANGDRPGGRRCRSKLLKSWQGCVLLDWWYGAPWKQGDGRCGRELQRLKWMRLGRRSYASMVLDPRPRWCTAFLG